MECLYMKPKTPLGMGVETPHGNGFHVDDPTRSPKPLPGSLCINFCNIRPLSTNFQSVGYHHLR